MALNFGPVDWTGPVPVPERLVNGGLYTGEAFKAGAAWGNTAIEPNAHTYMGTYAAMPDAARAHMPGYTRPGNNHQEMPAHRVFDATKYANMSCGTGGARQP